MWKKIIVEEEIDGELWDIERVVCSRCGGDMPKDRFDVPYYSRFCPNCGLNQFPTKQLEESYGQ